MSTEQVNYNQPLPTPPAVAPAPLPPAGPPTYPVPMRKSPGAAVALSFLTGLGHLYLGLYQRALWFFAAFAGSIFLADKADLGILVPFVWFFGLIDAYRQAQLINAGLAPEDLWATPARPQAGGSRLAFGVFLTLLGLLLLYNQFSPLDLTFLYDWWPLLLVGLGLWQIVKYVIAKQKAAAAESDPRTPSF